MQSCSRDHGPTLVCSLVGCLVLGSSEVSRYWILLVILWGCSTLYLLQSFPSLFPQGSPGPVQYLGVRICICLSQALVELLRVHPCQAVCISWSQQQCQGFDICVWGKSHVVVISAWPFLQSLLQFCPCISFRQEQSWDKILRWVDCQILNSGHVYLLEVVSSGSISTLLVIFAKGLPISTWDPLISLVFFFL